MNRPWHIWCMFGLGLAVVFGALGWITWKAVQLDRRQVESQYEAALEENVRLALGRMEQNLTALVVRESGRPYFWYSAFYPAERAYTNMFNPIARGEVLVPSPLLTEPLQDVLLHFQIDPAGEFTSPQVPTGNLRDLAEGAFLSQRQIERNAARLRQLRERVDRDGLLSRLPARRVAAVETADVDSNAAQTIERDDEKVQKEFNASEFQSRVQRLHQQSQQAAPARNLLLSAINVHEGTPVPVWQSDALLFVRRVTVSGNPYVQGCWLNCSAIRVRLLDDIADLLPGADLVPVRAVHGGSDPRVLASLPFRLIPGTLAAAPRRGISPIEVALVIAWSCIVLGAVAVGALLMGTVALSERRAAFVGAVTHELRTPLTTFRMYTEMLTERMVPDEERQRQYLSTLHDESQRLSHLVENVLAYARLERNRHGGHIETVSLGDLLSRTTERIGPRARQAGKQLEVTGDGPLLEQTVRADVSAVEQILFNLVDNACKYTAGAADARIHIEVRSDGRATALRVSDHGPGISRDDARRLFRPFTKSAHDAAHSAPGVGLGLTLSRRLAREMGGDLDIDHTVNGGACFKLTLPNA